MTDLSNLVKLLLSYFSSNRQNLQTLQLQSIKSTNLEVYANLPVYQSTPNLQVPHRAIPVNLSKDVA